MTTTTLQRTIKPVRPAAAYLGGKARLAKAIIARINEVPHTTYAEPFVGMGGIFLRRNRPATVEVINDLSGDVSTFFRILQRHHVHFMEMLRFQLSGRREFDRLVASKPETLTDLERSARFLYLQKLAFSGKLTGRTFAVRRDKSAYFNVTKLGPMLEDIHERLAGVTIESLPYDEFIRRYDHKSTLFYLDPPYWGCEDYYGKELFSRADFQKLAGVLRSLKGRFILSLNDTPGVRKVFANFNIEEVPVTYTTKPGMNKRTHELVISGH